MPSPRRPRALCVALAALICALAAAPASARVPKEWIGVMADGPLFHDTRIDVPRELRLMRGARVGSVRAAFYWSDIERQPGEYGWLATDMLVLGAAQQGIRILPTVLRTPDWAAVRPGEEGSPPRDVADYARFMAAAVRRYGPNGDLWRENPKVRKLPIRSWQVWNEPDIRSYWSADDWVSTYLELLRAARPAVKGADPRAKVVLAGLTNRSWEELRLLYRAGARRHFDVAAIHPFSMRVSNVVKIVRLARREMARAKDARKPLLLTEISWSSGKGRSTFNYGWETTERGQASKLREAFTTLARHRKRLRIAGVYWYTWLSYAPEGRRNSFDFAGLRRQRADGTPVAKPAYRTFKSVTRKLRR